MFIIFLLILFMTMMLFLHSFYRFLFLDEILQSFHKINCFHIRISCGFQGIFNPLAELDPENSDIYKENLRSYQEELSSLDNEYQKTVDQSTHKTLLFADRFPFRYLVDDYGISYYAAFSGCSAESEASFKTITFLAEKVDELGLKEVFTIEKSDDRIAETVIENTRDKDQKVAVLNSMQSITSEEIADETTYLSIMEDNLKVLKAALK